ncbi:MAG: hypothetical protein LBG68_01030, partial [Coriobacteriales bacterium]|nr:hypothetical protein [Coriobacteriales bacterium]
GGVCSAADVIEFILAGATVVAVGSYSFSDPLAIPRIHADLYDWCRVNNVSAIRDLRGAAHAARPA